MGVAGSLGGYSAGSTPVRGSGFPVCEVDAVDAVRANSARWGKPNAGTGSGGRSCCTSTQPSEKLDVGCWVRGLVVKGTLRMLTLALDRVGELRGMRTVSKVIWVGSRETRIEGLLSAGRRSGPRRPAARRDVKESPEDVECETSPQSVDL